MAVIINELEVVLEPPQSTPTSSAKSSAAEKPMLNQHDLLTVMDREQRDKLRLCAH